MAGPIIAADGDQERVLDEQGSGDAVASLPEQAEGTPDRNILSDVSLLSITSLLNRLWRENELLPLPSGKELLHLEVGRGRIDNADDISGILDVPNDNDSNQQELSSLPHSPLPSPPSPSNSEDGWLEPAHVSSTLEELSNLSSSPSLPPLPLLPPEQHENNDWLEPVHVSSALEEFLNLSDGPPLPPPPFDSLPSISGSQLLPQSPAHSDPDGQGAGMSDTRGDGTGDVLALDTNSDPVSLIKRSCSRSLVPSKAISSVLHGHLTSV